MNLKTRLQRVLQIVEEAESTGLLSDLEKDIALNELREAYAELKFGKTKDEETPIPPIAPITTIKDIEPKAEEDSEVEDEPEVEVELLFEENDEEEAENEEQPENEDQKLEVTDIASSTPTTHITPKRSPLLSLYEESAPILGEQFHEAPSLADAIACPKGLVEVVPMTSLREAIGVADKFMLVRELFGGDDEAYECAINNLEKQESFDDCIIYISEHYAWHPQSEATQFMMNLLQRKYNA